MIYLITGILLFTGIAPYPAEFPRSPAYLGMGVARTLGFVLTVLGMLGLKGLSGPLYSFSCNAVWGVWMIILGWGNLYFKPRDSGAIYWFFVVAGSVWLAGTLGEAYWYLYYFF